MLMRAVAALLIVLLVLLQVRLWVSEDGFRGVAQLRNQISTQRAENRELTSRNQRLESEVADLKQGFSALEERARSDLGLIAPNESFFIYSGRQDADPARAASR